MLAACSIVVGKKYKLNTSARLFVITLLLITFAGDSGKETSLYALARVGGILMGVVWMLILSVVVLPKSATVESLHWYVSHGNVFFCCGGMMMRMVNNIKMNK